MTSYKISFKTSSEQYDDKIIFPKTSDEAIQQFNEICKTARKARLVVERINVHPEYDSVAQTITITMTFEKVTQMVDGKLIHVPQYDILMDTGRIQHSD